MGNKKRRRPLPATIRKPRRSRLPTILTGLGLLAAIIAISATVGTDAASDISGVARDPATVAAGTELFTANCAVCHGADLRGSETGPPLLHPYYAPNHHADEAFQRAVAFGVVPHHWDFGPMQPLAHLNREDVAKVVAFVRTEQEAAGIFEDPSH